MTSAAQRYGLALFPSHCYSYQFCARHRREFPEARPLASGCLDCYPLYPGPVSPSLYRLRIPFL